jgi:hypothetical protein
MQQNEAGALVECHVLDRVIDWFEYSSTRMIVAVVVVVESETDIRAVV